MSQQHQTKDSLSSSSNKPLKIAFTHPDLGIGGAERLIVDAAVGLQNLKGHHVTVFTSHHDPKHCFSETCDGTLKVHVYGDFLPRALFGYFHVLFAILRMFYCSFMMYLNHSSENYDIIIVDQVSHHIPLLKLFFPKSKIIFYCHFPDKLLVRWDDSRISLLKKLYRIPFDYFEEVTTGMAHSICVNSDFTKQIFYESFKRLANCTVQVLYPPINVSSYDEEPSDSDLEKCTFFKRIQECDLSVVSINRFEKKKNIALLVKAFAKYVKPQFPEALLILAGGYDPRIAENIQVLEELKQLVKENDLQDQTIYVPSFNNIDRYVMLRYCTVVAYTPQGEHFGIVPVEAMYCERCVVALKSGGPKESIKDGETGLLAEIHPHNEEETVRNFGNCICEFLVMTPKQRENFGQRARQRVIDNFTLQSFATSLNRIIRS
nr:unnamed protein product [Naegleria fowleri]